MKKPTGIFVQEKWLHEDVCKVLVSMHKARINIGTGKDYSNSKLIHPFDFKKAGFTAEYGYLREVVLSARDEVHRGLHLIEPLYVEACFLVMMAEGSRHPKHQDNCKLDGTPNHTPQRDYSSLLYLNGDFEGGEIVFEKRGTLKPAPGMLIGFPSGFEYPHEVLPVISGNRYSVNIWYSLNHKLNLFKDEM